MRTNTKHQVLERQLNRADEMCELENNTIQNIQVEAGKKKKGRSENSKITGTCGPGREHNTHITGAPGDQRVRCGAAVTDRPANPPARST